MSPVLYSIYDSTDAAEFAATRLRRSVRGIRVAEVIRHFLPDESEETEVVAFPTLSPGGYSNLSQLAPTVPFISETLQDRQIEPSQRRDVTLRVVAADEKSAQQAMLILRSTGGREIRKMR